MFPLKGQIEDSCVSGFLTENIILERARECNGQTDDDDSSDSSSSSRNRNTCFKERSSSSNNGYSTRIIPELRVTCDGQLTGWRAAGEITRGSTSPLLQLWRETEGGLGTYENVAKDIPLGRCSGGNDLEEVSIRSNYYECTLETSIPIKIGDIVGIVLPRERYTSFRPYFTEGSIVNRVYNFHPLTVFPDRSQRRNRREYCDEAQPLIALKINHGKTKKKSIC